MSVADRPIDVLRESRIPGLELTRRGKVRDLYDLGDRLLVVATDRISAFDVVLPGGIPEKGRVLTQLSLFWFDYLQDVPNHLRGSRVDELEEALLGKADVAAVADQLRDRIMIVEKLDILPIECIVRGYLAGSGWVEYQKCGTVCGIPLPSGLQNSSRLPETIFTPSTKAEEGHDENISFDQAIDLVGKERAEEARDRSLEVYERAAAYARERGIIIADTKFEWGVRRSTGELVLADEVLTPDSSRFWPQEVYEPGKSQPSFDKQFVRDYLLSLEWDKQPPAPELPAEVVTQTAQKYREISTRLTETK